MRRRFGSSTAEKNDGQPSKGSTADAENYSDISAEWGAACPERTLFTGARSGFTPDARGARNLGGSPLIHTSILQGATVARTPPPATDPFP